MVDESRRDLSLTQYGNPDEQDRSGPTASSHMSIQVSLNPDEALQVSYHVSATDDLQMLEGTLTMSPEVMSARESAILHSSYQPNTGMFGCLPNISYSDDDTSTIRYDDRGQQEVQQSTILQQSTQMISSPALLSDFSGIADNGGADPSRMLGNENNGIQYLDDFYLTGQVQPELDDSSLYSPRNPGVMSFSESGDEEFSMPDDNTVQAIGSYQSSYVTQDSATSSYVASNGSLAHSSGNDFLGMTYAEEYWQPIGLQTLPEAMSDPDMPTLALCGDNYDNELSGINNGDWEGPLPDWAYQSADLSQAAQITALSQSSQSQNSGNNGSTFYVLDDNSDQLSSSATSTMTVMAQSQRGFFAQHKGRWIELQDVPQGHHCSSHGSCKIHKTPVINNFEPPELLPTDVARVRFDLNGHGTGSGIQMALLDDTYENTRQYVLYGEEPVSFLRSFAGDTYSALILIIKWPTYPNLSKNFSDFLLMRQYHYDAPQATTRAALAWQIVHSYKKFIADAVKETPIPGQPQFTFGPDALTLDNMWLVSLYQKTGQYFCAEIRVPVV